MNKFLKKLVSSVLSVATAIGATIGSSGLSVAAAGEHVVHVEYSNWTFNLDGGDSEQFPLLTADGNLAYCTDRFTHSGGGGVDSYFNSQSYYDVQSNISLALAYGYGGKTKYGYTDEEERIATQIVVWGITEGWFNGSNESTMVDKFCTTGNFSQYAMADNIKTLYNKIAGYIKSHTKARPSFNGATYKMSYNSSGKYWTLTLSDSNGVITSYDWSDAISGSSFLSIESQTASSITFKSTKKFDTTTLYAKIKGNAYYSSVRGLALTHYSGTNQQDCVEVRTTTNQATVKLYAEEATGDIEIEKTIVKDGTTLNPGSNELSTLISQLNFRVYTTFADAQNNSGSNLVKFNGSAGNYTYNTSGSVTELKLAIYPVSSTISSRIRLNGLPAGTYYIRETVSSNSAKWTCSDSDSVKSVVVTAGESAGDNEVLFENTYTSKGTLSITKTLAKDGTNLNPGDEEYEELINNLTFRVYKTESDALNGKNPMGFQPYQDGYKPADGTDLTNTSSNIKLRVFGTTQYSPTYARIYNLPAGTYYVREIDNNEGWTCTDDDNVIAVTVTDNTTSSAEFTNEKETPQTGGVTVQKKITLNGATYNPYDKTAVLGALSFQIARDKDMSDIVHFTGSAGAYTYAESGGVTELKLNTSTGKFNASELPVGKYWIKELGSGEGYEIVGGNPQEFTITEDQTSNVNVVIENGVTPGNGKIIKTFVNNSHSLSAAEKAELYKQIYFTIQQNGQYIIATETASGKYSFSQWTSRAAAATHLAPNSSGEIEISNLPVGKYTVIEYCTAVGYEPTTPATQTITVEEGKTAEVKFVNTYRMPEIGTLATINGEKASFTSQNATIVIDDVITYKDLIVGEQYTVKGVLYDKSTGKPFLVSGKQATAEKTFTAANANGTVSVSFDIPASVITEKTSLVVFEQLLLTDSGTVLASHENIEDEGQTVVIHVPEIATVATVNTEKDVFAAQGMIDIIDEISYHDLIQSSRFVAGGDKLYTLVGTLYDRATGKPFLLNGEKVTATTSFEADDEDGKVTVKFSFDASNLTKNTDLVVFEELYFKGVKIADEQNINNTDQTITVHTPDIKTTATSDNEHDTFAAFGNITIKDTVRYTDLIVGKQYNLTGVLMNKTTGEPFTVNGKQVTSTATFTAQTANGNVDVYFTFDASAITANTQTVAFETLTYNGYELAVHADLTDQSQTVTVHTPKIGTTASVNDEQEIFSADGKITLKDVVSFNDLITGKEYTIKGIIYDKSTNAPFLVNGAQVTAEKKFTPKSANGTETVEFTFDVSAIGKNTSLVVYEEIYYAGTKLTEHKDINDNGQTIIVHAPTVGTTATVNNEHDTFIANKTITIKDVVSYTDLIIGKQYTVSGVIMDKATGEQFMVDGKPITAATTFTATTANGTVNVTFVFDVSAITKNTDLVVYEELYSPKNVKIAEHKNIEDKGQTITVHNPQIGTTATVGDDEKDDFAIGFVTIKDVVKYTDLIPNKEYKVIGVLMNKNTGKELLIGGATVTSEATFTPTTADGEVEVTFTFDATELTENTKVVVFEHLFLGDLELTAHTDIEDEGQTIALHKPDAQTTAIIGKDKEIFAAFGEITLTDTVDYTDLIIGKTYTVKGKLYDKATNKPFLVDGKEIVGETTFVAESTDGSVEVNFTFDVSFITETTDLVAFESVYQGTREVAVHADIDDESQTIKVRTPDIATTATVSGETIEKEKEVFVRGLITITDVVSYHDLIIGKEYTVKGVLMDKSTGEEWIDNTGNPIAGQTTFTADDNNGTVEVTFTFDAQGVNEETDLVVFEKLYNVGIEICNHEDISDDGQTVKLRSPEIGTKAQTDDGKKETFAVGEITIVDTVEYHDLIVGKEYSVQGILMDKSTNEPLMIDGSKVTAETTFTAESTDGEVKLTFTFAADGITTRTTVVAFETLYHEDVEFAVHADINDEDQSVLLHKPSIHTTASINGEKEIFAPKHITIVDTVAYDDLVTGEEYVVKGTLMNKLTGNPYLIGGQPVTAETKFVAETESGTIDVPFEFEFDPDITSSVDFVVFQRLYLSGAEAEGEEIAVHEDIEDMGQTVTVKPNPPEEIPDTGVGVNITLVIGCLIALAGAVIVFALKKREER